MRSVFSFDEIRKIEADIINGKQIPSLILMENAGKNAFTAISNIFHDLNRYMIFIICGKGNNAGDGYVIARHMVINNLEVNVISLAREDKLKGDALLNFRALKNIESDHLTMHTITSQQEWKEILKLINKKSKTLIIDAILGTGIKGEPEDTFAVPIRDINEFKNKNNKTVIISIDVPSGLSSDFASSQIVSADLTITMGTFKTELLFGPGYENAGTVIPVDIGITDDLFEKLNSHKKFLVEDSDIRKLLPIRKKTSHKYTNGKLLVIGGSRSLSGALAMASLSAIRSGSGGVAAAFPDSIEYVFSKKNFDIMKVILNSDDNGTIASDNYSKLIKRIEWTDAVLIGPGIGTGEGTKKFFQEFITECPKNIVIDADALNILSENIDILKNRKHKNNIILTPHIGEFSKLTKSDSKEIINNRFEILNDFVNEFDVDVVLKSERSVSCIKRSTGCEYYINSSGNEALATAGTGDILAGIITSLFAQTNDAYISCVCGNYIHGLCADIYYEQYGNKQTAAPRDLLKILPKAITSIIN